METPTIVISISQDGHIEIHGPKNAKVKVVDYSDVTTEKQEARLDARLTKLTADLKYLF